MKNLKIWTIVVLILIAVGLIAALTIKPDKGVKVPAGSDIVGAEGYLYYTNKDNNVVRRTISDESEVVIAENATVLDAYKDEVIVKRYDFVLIMNSDGEHTDFSHSAELENVQLTSDYVYYKEPDTGYISRIVRETGETESVINIVVDKFIIDGNRIIFTTDGKMLFTYDMATGMSASYLAEKAIVEFDMDEDWIFYSDANNGYKISKFNINDGREIEVKNVKSKTIEYKNGRLFYLDDVKGNKKYYTLRANEDDVHKG